MPQVTRSQMLKKCQESEEEPRHPPFNPLRTRRNPTTLFNVTWGHTILLELHCSQHVINYISASNAHALVASYGIES